MPHEVDRAILLRYHEIALKGGNRGFFEKRLAENAERQLRARFPGTSVRTHRRHGRILVYTPWVPGVPEALSRVFGIKSFSPMRVVETDLAKIESAALEEMASFIATHGIPKSFRVDTRRSEKALPQTSVEIDAKIGKALMDRFPGLKVSLKNHESSVGIEIRHRESFVWMSQIEGPGGLPVGTNSKVLTLLSGGIDSPVAAILAMKRGVSTDFIHFHGAPFIGDEILTKIDDLLHIISSYAPRPLSLCIIPFGKIQEKIALRTHSRLRTVLYRRMMVRIACRVARLRRARALITGESIGQVASQTIDNLAVIDQVSDLTILRPLITYDKDEIIRAAQRWGTFDVSVRPSPDCCTLFGDRHPVTRATLSEIEDQEQAFPVEEYVSEALNQMYFPQSLMGSAHSRHREIQGVPTSAVQST